MEFDSGFNLLLDAFPFGVSGMESRIVAESTATIQRQPLKAHSVQVAIAEWSVPQAQSSLIPL